MREDLIVLLARQGVAILQEMHSLTHKTGFVIPGEGKNSTVRWLKVWLEQAEIKEGAVFRRLIGSDQIDGPLNPESIAPIFKRVAQWIGTPAQSVARE
jgi:hypothetical protein